MDRRRATIVAAAASAVMLYAHAAHAEDGVSVACEPQIEEANEICAKLLKGTSDKLRLTANEKIAEAYEAGLRKGAALGVEAGAKPFTPKRGEDLAHSIEAEAAWFREKVMKPEEETASGSPDEWKEASRRLAEATDLFSNCVDHEVERTKATRESVQARAEAGGACAEAYRLQQCAALPPNPKGAKNEEWIRRYRCQ